MVATVGVDAQLIDYLEMGLAPVTDVDKRVIERSAIITLEGVDASQCLCSVIDIWCGDTVEQTRKFAISEFDAIQGFEFLPKVGLQRSTVTDVRTLCVFELAQLGDKVRFDVLFR